MRKSLSDSLGVAALIAALMLLTVKVSLAGFPQDEFGSIKTRTCITELPSLAKISYRDAVKTALAKTPGGVLEVELEDEDGYLVFCVEVVSAKGEIMEYVIDAGNGAVLEAGEEEEKEDKDDAGEMKPGSIRVSYGKADYPGMAKIGLDQAVKTAKDQVGGKFLAAELEGDDGILVWEVVIISPKKAVMEVEIDAATGKILEIEEEGCGEED